ncbi:MAG TPA: DHA2 family efflux MFS transporter permease subunit [Burkholderiaceae bacterium]|nr:DHA2 family efflux MFS transporter permease subunit [Burkholderiaceae bacterium]
MSIPAPSSVEAMRLRHGEHYRWKLLLTVMVGTVASILSSTIVNVAVPDLSRYFSLGQERAQWVSAGFMAAMTLSMLPTPWLLSRFGYRRAFAGAVTLLGIGGAVGGLANSFELVLGMRVAEGLAAGVLAPIPSIIVMRAFDSGQQGRAMGIFGFGVVLAPAVGPSVGGILVEAFGWRSIFFVVLPFCAWALWLARRYLPHAAPGGIEPGSQTRPLDFVGLALVTAAVLALLNGLVSLHGRSATTGLWLLGASGVLMVVFVAHLRRAAHPLIDLRLFASGAFAAGSCVAFIYGMGLFGSTYLVPVFMQSALHFPPSQAGAVLLPAGFVLAGTIPLAGRLADRFAPRGLVALGVTLLAASFALMATVGPGTSLLVLATWAVLGRIGLGLVLPSLNLGSMRGLDVSLVPQASSTINFTRQLGGAIGVSVVGIFLEWRHQVRGAQEALAAFADTFWLIAIVSALALLAALRMRARAAATPHS